MLDLSVYKVCNVGLITAFVRRQKRKEKGGTKRTKGRLHGVAARLHGFKQLVQCCHPSSGNKKVRLAVWHPVVPLIGHGSSAGSLFPPDHIVSATAASLCQLMLVKQMNKHLADARHWQNKKTDSGLAYVQVEAYRD